MLYKKLFNSAVQFIPLNISNNSHLFFCVMKHILDSLFKKFSEERALIQSIWKHQENKLFFYNSLGAIQALQHLQNHHILMLLSNKYFKASFLEASPSHPT